MYCKKKYALITGASSGIGMEFARQLADMGYNLILAARRKERLEKLASELKNKETDIMIITVDLSKTEECERLIKETEKIPVTIFINNAGFGACGRFMDSDVKRDLEMIDVNDKAMHFLMKLMLVKMEKQKRGYILNVVSSAGLLPAGPYMATYYASKAYMASLTRAVAAELKQSGSRVYVGALCPGPVDTEFNKVANVEFALPGITTKYCVSYALRQMKRRRVVIVPKLALKAATTLGRFIPQKILIAVTGHQQKKKMEQ